MAGVSDEYKAKLRRRNASQLGDSNTLEQVVEAVDKDTQTMPNYRNTSCGHVARKHHET